MNLKELTSKLTKEELLELEAATSKPIIYDEDSPEMTEEMLMQFKSWRLMMKKCKKSL